MGVAWFTLRGRRIKNPTTLCVTSTVPPEHGGPPRRKKPGAPSTTPPIKITNREEFVPPTVKCVGGGKKSSQIKDRKKFLGGEMGCGGGCHADGVNHLLFE